MLPKAGFRCFQDDNQPQDIIIECDDERLAERWTFGDGVIAACHLEECVSTDAQFQVPYRMIIGSVRIAVAVHTKTFANRYLLPTGIFWGRFLVVLVCWWQVSQSSEHHVRALRGLIQCAIPYQSHTASGERCQVNKEVCCNGFEPGQNVVCVVACGCQRE